MVGGRYILSCVTVGPTCLCGGLEREAACHSFLELVPARSQASQVLQHPCLMLNRVLLEVVLAGPRCDGGAMSAKVAPCDYAVLVQVPN